MTFVTAIPTAIKVAELLSEGYKFIKEHPEEVQQAVNEAAKAVNAAQQLVDNAKDLVGADEAVAKAMKAANDAGVTLGVTRDAATKASGEALVGLASAARKAADIVSGHKDETPEEAAARKAEAEAAKAIVRARQAVLEAADLSMSLTKMVSRLGSSDDAKVAAIMEALDGPGVFALATYPQMDFDRDLTDYKGVYVGKDVCVGDGIATAISRAGNADVYADIKYGQNVWVYVYRCVEDDIRGRCYALKEVLGANRSYNLPNE